MHVYIYIYIYICTHTLIYIYVYTHIHIQVVTYIHTTAGRLHRRRDEDVRPCLQSSPVLPIGSARNRRY